MRCDAYPEHIQHLIIAKGFYGDSLRESASAVLLLRGFLNYLRHSVLRKVLRRRSV
jgi:hypothetical protein